MSSLTPTGSIPEKPKKRPGKTPALPDEKLTKIELERRNKRRKQNRENAQRTRDNRVQSICKLENQVADLRDEHDALVEENSQLRVKVNRLRSILRMDENIAEPVHKKVAEISNTESHLSEESKLARIRECVTEMKNRKKLLTAKAKLKKVGKKEPDRIVIKKEFPDNTELGGKTTYNTYYLIYEERLPS